ncbi:MAG: NUDIX domain-containing protein [Gammaproteobacteria bacterium]|nr:NUDIX domain-containing protein [Gammaproteobacteria bacterium]
MSERHRFPVLVHTLIFSADQLLLLRRAGTGLYDGFWAPPGGHMEAGETPREAALRETREELGFALDCEQLQAVGLMHYAGGGGGFNLLFAARLEQQRSPQFDRNIADAAQWWPRQALPEARVRWLDAAVARCDRGALEQAAAQGAPPRWYVEGP